MNFDEQLERHQGLLVGLGVASLAFVVVSLARIPVLIARLPPDYFVHEKREAYWLKRLSPGLRVAAIVAKNVIGLLVVVCGVAMLVLPGQGLLTLLLGLSLLDFPGKYRLERWLLGRPSVMRGLNWLRRRLKKPPFAAPSRA
ncbi:MAG: PGPGW domain-containing protein [Polyangiaceae bacterium]